MRRIASMSLAIGLLVGASATTAQAKIVDSDIAAWATGMVGLNKTSTTSSLPGLPDAAPAPAATDPSAPAAKSPDTGGITDAEAITNSALRLVMPDRVVAHKFSLRVEVYAILDGFPGFGNSARASASALGSNLSGSIAGCPEAKTCEYFDVSADRVSVDPRGAADLVYRYNDAGRPVAAPGLSDVRAATAEWSRWNRSIKFSFAGATTAVPGASTSASCGDGVNTVGWAPIQAFAAGVTYICTDQTTGKIVDIDTAYNSTLSWAHLAANDPNSKSFDLQSVATHEFGHWQALLDMNGLFARDLTMHESAAPGEMNKRTLALGDILGTRAAYPCGTCSAPTGVVADKGNLSEFGF